MTFEEACRILKDRGLLLKGDSIRVQMSERTPIGYKIVFVRNGTTHYAYEVGGNGTIQDFSEMEREKAKFRADKLLNRMESFRRLLEYYKKERNR